MLTPSQARPRRPSSYGYLLGALLLVPLGAAAALLLVTACGHDVEIPSGHRYLIVRYDLSLPRDTPPGFSHQLLVGPGDQTDATVFRWGPGCWIFGVRRDVSGGP